MKRWSSNLNTTQRDKENDPGIERNRSRKVCGMAYNGKRIFTQKYAPVRSPRNLYEKTN